MSARKTRIVQQFMKKQVEQLIGMDVFGYPLEVRILQSGGLLFLWPAGQFRNVSGWAAN